MKPQKPNRRKSREAALHVLFCQSFTDQEMSGAISGVESTQTVEAMQETLQSLKELRTALDATTRSLTDVIAAFADATKHGTGKKKMKKVEEGTLPTRLHLIETRRQAAASMKSSMTVLENTDVVFQEGGFAHRLLETYEKQRVKVESVLEKSLQGWAVRRLTAEDAALLRLGLVELLYFEDVPQKVAVNEYLELAKSYSDADSTKLINGVLDRVMHDHPRADPPKS